MQTFITRLPRLTMMAAMALFLAAGPAAQAQQPPAKQQAPPKRAKRVWTNDDVENLRSPSDAYLRDKERMQEDARRAKEAADAAAKSAADKGEAPAAPSEYPGAEAAEKPAVIPTTIPALEKRFAELSEKITSLESRIAGIEELKATGREDERAGADELKNTLQKELDKTNEEFYTVRDRLNALRRRP